MVLPELAESGWSSELRHNYCYSVFASNNTDEIAWSLTRKFPISLTLFNYQRCLKSEIEEIFTIVSRFSILQQIVHVHAMRSLRHSCLLQASIDREW